MKMDRNIADDGLGKYAVINLRKLKVWQRVPEIQEAIKVLEAAEALEWGRTGAPDEFFLIKLKDKHAQAALFAYAASAEVEDREWAQEVDELARRSGPAHPLCKRPD